MIVGRPVFVPRDADKEAMEEIRLRLEKEMQDITTQADSYWDGNNNR